jgi:light-regulated signal transduction histidine kinase (bacteriophytochrome)
MELSFGEITHPEDRTHSERLLSQLVCGDIPYLTHEQKFLRKTGDPVWVRISASAVRDESGNAKDTICLVEEITFRRQAEEALAAQAAELARSNADLQQFAWVTSHDLREPIRTLIAFSQLLLLRYRGKLDDEADKALEFIRNSARRMESLVGDLLTYSRIVNVEERPFARVSLNSALDWAMSNLQVTIIASEAIVHRDSLPDVLGDEVQIVQLLQNLLSNAIKYRGAESPEIRVSARRADGEYVICFQDNGVGIDRRYHERIFGLFKRLHGTEIQGTGLGLAICRKIIERHGGRIWVESEPGKGSTFCFTLAAAD